MNRRMTMEHNTTASRSGEWASRRAEDACAKATRAAVGAAEVEGADEADGRAAQMEAQLQSVR